MTTQIDRRFDFSGGIQRATTWLLRKPNEIENAINGRFDTVIGAIVRRLGYAATGSALQANKSCLGMHESKFSAGAKLLAAINDSGNTETKIKSYSSGSWSDLTLPSTVAASTKMQFIDSVGETYIAGISGTTRMSLLNMKDATTVSATRNLIGAPKSRLIAEYGGSLYAINCDIGGTVYNDRAYKSSPPLGVVTYIQGAQTGTLTSLRVDSTRYLKAGMAIDIYTAGSETKLYDLTITSVDKAAETISFGSTSITVADNDEIWLDGRKNELSYLWNTDYPTVQKADYLRIPPGLDSDSEITAWAKSNNRLFLFTKHSLYKWDGANLVTVFEDIGCQYHATIQNIGDWLIWLDAEGRVHARNDGTGQHEVISRSISDLLLEVTDYSSASAGRIGNIYKLCLGTVGGKVRRLCYDFDSNTWANEQHVLSMTAHARSDMSGIMKLYFIGSDGQMYMDESGNTDNGITIPFIVTFGRTNQNSEQKKKFHGVYVFGANITGSLVKASIDNGDIRTAGSIKQDVDKILLSGIKNNFLGRDINVSVSSNSDGESPRIEALAYYYNQEEDKC